MSGRSASTLKGLVKRLRAWQRSHGAVSDSALRRTREGMSIINAASLLSRQGELPGEGSPLTRLCEAANVPVRRRQRSHSPEETVELLRERWSQGLPCHPRELLEDDEWRPRYNSIRKHHGWERIVLEVLHRELQARPSALARLEDLRWYMCELSGAREHLQKKPDAELSDRGLKERLAEVFRLYLEQRGGDLSVFIRSRFEKDPLGASLHSSIGNLERRRGLRNLYPETVERVTGERPRLESRQGARSRLPTTHALEAQGRSHSRLRSDGEVLCDEALALYFTPKAWESMHRHDPTIADFAPDLSRRYTADIAVVGPRGNTIALIDIGAGALARDADYRTNRKLKRQALRRARGPLYVECDLRNGPRAAKDLQRLLQRVAEAMGKRWAPKKAEAAVRGALATRSAGAVALELDETRRWVRARGLRTHEDYKHAKEDARCNGDPLAPYLPALTSSRLKRWGATWYEIAGRPPVGQGSRRAREKLGMAVYDTYSKARRAARRGGFKSAKDYRDRRMKIDARLPVNPEALWPDEFIRDGWPGYLGSGTPNSDLSGLIPQGKVWAALGLTHARFKKLLDARAIEPAASRERRTQGASLYFREEDVLALARELKLTGLREIRRKLREARRP